jgi:hypothetical protein
VASAGAVSADRAAGNATTQEEELMAAPPKGKAPASDSIMDPGEMKPLLALSKREPVHAAVGITSDGDGVILLDKKMKSKKVLATLKAAAAKAKIQLQPSTLRFGRAEVDTDYDSGMVRFFLNKDAPGNMRVKLLEVVKRVPYQKVEINVDPSFEEESEDETEGQEATATNAIPAAPPAPPPSAPPPPGQPALDAKALEQTLAQLTLAIPKVAGGDDALQKSLVALAMAAQGSLKVPDLAKASEGIEALRRALGEAMDAAKLKAAGPGVVAYAKSRLAWIAARKKMETDLDALRVKIVETFKDDAIAPQIETNYRAKVAPVLAKLDASLADKLDEATNATDPAARSKLVAEAKSKLAFYASYLAAEPLLKDLDENPFLPLTIRATIGGTIQQLSRIVT